MRKLYILVAEDDVDDRYLLETAFAEKGYAEELAFVENGVELLDYLNNQLASPEGADANLPRFILLDLNMPKKNGREALKEIKEDVRLKKIPVIVFTTNKNENEIRRCYELGANTYIVKPVEFSALLNTVQDIRAYWMNTAEIAG
jgi:CheY-like chemotaxis protein